MNKLKSIVTDKRIMAAAVMALGVTVAVSTFASGGPRAGSSSQENRNHTLEVQTYKPDGTALDGIPFKYSCIRTVPNGKYPPAKQAYDKWTKEHKQWEKQTKKWRGFSDKKRKNNPKLRPGAEPRKPFVPERENWDRKNVYKSGSASTGTNGRWSSDDSQATYLSPYAPAPRNYDFKVQCTVDFSRAGNPDNANSAPYYLIGECKKTSVVIHHGGTAVVRATYGKDVAKAERARKSQTCLNLT